MSNGEIIDRMFGAFSAGDFGTVRSCFTPDAAIWHSYDRVVQNPVEASRDWEAMMAHLPICGAHEVNRQATPTGFVQQHIWAVETAAGKRMAWPVCVVVTVQDGLIARLDEYIDRAGSFEPGG